MATGPVGGRGRDDDDSDIVGMLKGCRWLEWVGGYGRAEGELSHAQAGYQRGLGQRDGQRDGRELRARNGRELRAQWQSTTNSMTVCHAVNAASAGRRS